MRPLRVLLLLALAVVAGCATVPDKFAAIDSCLEAGRAWDYRGTQCGPVASGPVNLIVVDKSRHWMSVYRDGRLIREFRVALGRGGQGAEAAARRRQGSRGPLPHNRPQPRQRLSSFAQDRLSYRAANRGGTQEGINPGGDIMIHGLPNDVHDVGSRHTMIDWTDGCIAVANREIEWLYRAVPNGTPVRIQG